MDVPANNAARIAELEARRDEGNDYGIYEATQLALLTGVPVPLPGSETRGRFFVGDERYIDGKPVFDWATCGACGLSWNDALITAWTPAPSARCPFEYEHKEG
jgi:hypothetical protein